MSELKAFDIVVAEEGYCEGIVKYGRAVYDKSEADKVIAEKDKEIARLNDKALQYKVLDKEHCRDLNTQEKRFALQIAHQKYKRCLAMAMWCETRHFAIRYLQADKISNDENYIGTFYYIRREYMIKHYCRWANKWLELAEKFKEE